MNNDSYMHVFKTIHPELMEREERGTGRKRERERERENTLYQVMGRWSCILYSGKFWRFLFSLDPLLRLEMVVFYCKIDAYLPPNEKSSMKP